MSVSGSLTLRLVALWATGERSHEGDAGQSGRGNKHFGQSDSAHPDLGHSRVPVQGGRLAGREETEEGLRQRMFACRFWPIFVFEFVSAAAASFCLASRMHDLINITQW